MLEIRLLLRASQPVPPLRLVLLLGLIGFFLLGLLPPLLAVLFYPLRLGLLVRGGLGVGFGFGFGGFGFFLALYVGVFGRVPGVEDLLRKRVSLLLCVWLDGWW